MRVPSAVQWRQCNKNIRSDFACWSAIRFKLNVVFRVQQYDYWTRSRNSPPESRLLSPITAPHGTFVQMMIILKSMLLFVINFVCDWCFLLLWFTESDLKNIWTLYISFQRHINGDIKDTPCTKKTFFHIFTKNVTAPKIIKQWIQNFYGQLSQVLSWYSENFNMMART